MEGAARGTAIDAAVIAATGPVSLLAGTVAAGCGSVLAVRRLEGAIHAVAGAEAVLATCATGFLLVAVADLGSRPRSSVWRSRTAGTPLPGRGWERAVARGYGGGLARAGLALAMAAVSLPVRWEPTPACLAVAGALAATLVACVSPVAWGRAVRTGSGSAVAAPPCRVASPIPAVATAAPAAGSVTQRFERRVQPDGSECVYGRVCVAVPEGARTGWAHVGFCPPLAALPMVDVTTDYDGVEAVVSAAEVLPWGVRIECRLDEPADEAIEIPVDFLARPPA